MRNATRINSTLTEFSSADHNSMTQPGHVDDNLVSLKFYVANYIEYYIESGI